MNRVVVITGVSSGIGKATTEVFASKGWEVIGISRRSPDPTSAVDHHIPGDVSDAQEIQRIFSEIEQITDHADTLINNAALQICKPLIDTTVDEWDAIFNTNVRSAFLCSKHCYHLMRGGNGAIVNVSSVHAVATSKDIAAYASSKGALLALTRAMAIEFGSQNIRVNAVLPGAVETPMLRNGLARGHAKGATMKEAMEDLCTRHILGKIGKPDDISRLIYFLSDHQQSSFITGQGFIIDGGATSKLSTE